jgi:hypothetical protein
MSTSRIIELSQLIATNTAKVNDYLIANNLPTPSFDVDAPLQSLVPSNEPDIIFARDSAIQACVELRQLLLGPREHITSYQVSMVYMFCCS